MIRMTQPLLGPEEIEAVTRVLQSGMIAQGMETKQFEEEFADYCGTDYAVAVNSGTAALHCALYACGIKPGDEVITSPFTFVATANSILMQGATPVFADIDSETYNIDPEEVRKKITAKTKAIVVVHLYGQVADMNEMIKIAKDHSLLIIEDACQAHGAQQNERRAGSFGQVGCFSFYATKNMTTGEGGVAVTNDEVTYRKLKQFRHHGQEEGCRYEYSDLGYNYRMTDIAAAIGREQLKRLKNFNEKRNHNASALNEALNGVKGLRLPKVETGNRHVFHQYTIALEDGFPGTREQLIEYLAKRGIGTSIHYPKPLHYSSHLSKLGYKKGDFLVAEKASERVFSLPVHPSIKDEEIVQIAQAIKDFIADAE